VERSSLVGWLVIVVRVGWLSGHQVQDGSRSEERSSLVGWLVIVVQNGLVERSSGAGWLAIRGAVIISWMARDRCSGWLVERSSGVGWLAIRGAVIIS
jgi:hypothetical protein